MESSSEDHDSDEDSIQLFSSKKPISKQEKPIDGQESAKRTKSDHKHGNSTRVKVEPVSSKQQKHNDRDPQPQSESQESDLGDRKGLLGGKEEKRSFAALGLERWLVNACETMGLKRPTDVQWNCIPVVLKCQNVLASAQTGSGKTAAFALPILQLLSQDPFGVFALVLTPTRELAFQIRDQFVALGTQVATGCHPPPSCHASRGGSVAGCANGSRRRSTRN